MSRSRPGPPASSSRERPRASERLPSRPRTLTPGTEGTRRLVQDLALVRRGNLEFFAVLCDGAPREHKAFTLQDADDFRVAERLSRIFVFDDLANPLLDRH